MTIFAIWASMILLARILVIIKYSNSISQIEKIGRVE